MIPQPVLTQDVEMALTRQLNLMDEFLKLDARIELICRKQKELKVRELLEVVNQRRSGQSDARKASIIVIHEDIKVCLVFSC